MVTNTLGLISLDHMTHVDNLDTIFKYGLYSHSNPYKKRDISNKDVNIRRECRENIYLKKVHDYVPFYFNPRNAMMYKNKDEDIVVLSFSVDLLSHNRVLFTDKNAATESVKFYNSISDLSQIDWQTVLSESWNTKPPAVKQIMMAEVLVPEHVSMQYFVEIHCKNETTKKFLMDKYNLNSNQIKINPNLFFN